MGSRSWEGKWTKVLIPILESYLQLLTTCKRKTSFLQQCLSGYTNHTQEQTPCPGVESQHEMLVLGVWEIFDFILLCLGNFFKPYFFLLNTMVSNFIFIGCVCVVCFLWFFIFFCLFFKKFQFVCLSISFLRRDRKKEEWSWMGRKVGSGKRWGRGNWDQNILY